MISIAIFSSLILMPSGCLSWQFDSRHDLGNIHFYSNTQSNSHVSSAKDHWKIERCDQQILNYLHACDTSPFLWSIPTSSYFNLLISCVCFSLIDDSCLTSQSLIPTVPFLVPLSIGAVVSSFRTLSSVRACERVWENERVKVIFPNRISRGGENGRKHNGMCWSLKGWA